MGDDDSLLPLLICYRQLLIEHVIVALHVVVSDGHHRTFIYIETHLPLVCPLNKFIISSYSSIMSSGFLVVTKFGIISKFRHFADFIII